jgi:hypothetical protein
MTKSQGMVESLLAHEIVPRIDIRPGNPLQCANSGRSHGKQTLNYCLNVGRKKARK